MDSRIDSQSTKAKTRELIKAYLHQTPNFFTLFLVPITFLSIGPALIEMGKDFGTTPENINLIFTFFPAGMVAGQLTSTFWNRRFKRANIIITAYSILIAINIYLFFAENLYMYYILSVVGGYLLGVNYVQSTENIIACNIKNKDRLFILMITFYPLGALVAPLISSTFVDNDLSWRYTYLVVAIAIIVTLILYMTISLRGQNRIIAEEIQKTSVKEIFVDRQKNIIFIITLLLAAVYVASETVIATWSPTYLRLEKGLDITNAAFSITILMIFMIVGRITVSIIVGRVRSKTIMVILSGIAIISIIFIVLVETRNQVFAAMAMAGIGFSAMYPLIVSSGSAVYEKGRGLLASLVFASAYFGKTLAPYITKLIADFNITFSITVSLIFSGISTLLIIFLIFYERSIIKGNTIPNSG